MTWVRHGVWEEEGEDGADATSRVPTEGSDEWLIEECEDALEAYGLGMATVLPLEAELALVCLETGYTRGAGSIAEEDARFVRVLRAAAAAKAAREMR